MSALTRARTAVWTAVAVLGLPLAEQVAQARDLGRRHRHRPRDRHRPDDGYTTETVIVTALLAAAAIAVIAIIVAKVRDKANSITM